MIKEPEDCSRINEAIAKLLEFFASNTDIDHCDYVKYIQMIREECDKGLEYRVYASKKNAYNLILDEMKKFDQETIDVNEGLKALSSLMTQQPDLLDERGIKVIIDYLDRKNENETRRLLFKWIKECCILHEMNRFDNFSFCSTFCFKCFVILGKISLTLAFWIILNRYYARQNHLYYAMSYAF